MSNGHQHRLVVLDTETTGLEIQDGHRIIEIGAVEIIDRRPTGQRFHVYLNPERNVDAGAFEVHGLSDDFLSDKPLFSDIQTDLLSFLSGSELIIHNAAFDTGFINQEFQLCNPSVPIRLENHCTIIDTLDLARKKHPGQRNNLDSLCKRYGVNNSQRDLHGALLDAELLAAVYLAMTGGQLTMTLEDTPDPLLSGTSGHSAGVLALAAGYTPYVRPAAARFNIIQADSEALAAHAMVLQRIAKNTGNQCLWLNMTQTDLE